MLSMARTKCMSYVPMNDMKWNLNHSIMSKKVKVQNVIHDTKEAAAKTGMLYMWTNIISTQFSQTCAHIIAFKTVISFCIILQLNRRKDQFAKGCF